MPKNKAGRPKKNKGRNKGWDNLVPAKKGEIRNPKGRPKKALCISDLLNKVGDEKVPDKYLGAIQKIYPEIKNISHREALQRLAYHYAFKGQSWAFTYIAERTEGKPIENKSEEYKQDWTQTQTIYGMPEGAI